MVRRVLQQLRELEKQVLGGGGLVQKVSVGARLQQDVNKCTCIDM